MTPIDLAWSGDPADIVAAAEPDPGELLKCIAARLPTWHRDAACRGTEPSTFFPGIGQANTTALAICATCPVRADCLADALAQPAHLDHGVTAQARRLMRRTPLAPNASSRGPPRPHPQESPVPRNDGSTPRPTRSARRRKAAARAATATRQPERGSPTARADRRSDRDTTLNVEPSTDTPAPTNTTTSTTTTGATGGHVPDAAWRAMSHDERAAVLRARRASEGGDAQVDFLGALPLSCAPVPATHTFSDRGGLDDL